MKQPSLVFDLGGVVIDVAPSEETLTALAAAADTPIEQLRAPLREAFTARPFSLAERFQAGELAENDFLSELDALLVRPLGAEGLRGHLTGMLRGEIAETATLIAELTARYRVACYSNTNAVHWRYVLAHFDCMTLFAPRWASHEVGLVKPDPRVFDYLQQRLQSPPEQCVLIDDRSVNVAAAARAGWAALQFTSAAQLRVDLAAMDILA